MVPGQRYEDLLSLTKDSAAGIRGAYQMSTSQPAREGGGHLQDLVIVIIIIYIF